MEKSRITLHKLCFLERIFKDVNNNFYGGGKKHHRYVGFRNVLGYIVLKIVPVLVYKHAFAGRNTQHTCNGLVFNGLVFLSNFLLNGKRLTLSVYRGILKAPPANPRT